LTAYADLEIALHRRDISGYAVEVRYSGPGSDADVRLAQGEPALARFDLERLRALALDDGTYGQRLTEGLLADSAVRTAFAQARAAAQSQGAVLRLRLLIGPSAPDLHTLHWETLRDPQDGSPLFTGEQILFSRYLSSLDWRPAGPRPKGALRAVVVVASPAGVERYKPGGQPLAPLDVDGEVERARAGLAGIPITVLASGGSATLDKLTGALRDGCEVLYLVCHGALIQGEPHLYLEDDADEVKAAAGSELVARLKELRRPPRLVVLASCQSAGTGEETRSSDEGALVALGPRLAEAGVPAVLAMQGTVTMQTVALFMPVFFRELQRDGQIDRAMAVARGAVREQPDWWVPVLFMRLKSGRLWYAPGFAEERPGLEKWPSLVSNIRQRRCTPILGPGLTDSLVGSRRQIAESWAKERNYPLQAHDRENLPRVAQFLAVDQDRQYPRTELAEHVRREVLRAYGATLPQGMEQAGLDDLISEVGRQRRAQDPAQPHRVLAELPLPLYITANFGSLLTDALREAGKDPQVALCPWNRRTSRLPSVYDAEPDYGPTVERPLVYHLFGHLNHPESVVLTEDDYFDYLIGVARNRDRIPEAVRRRLTDSALLFLGFRMDEWDFRVLFRSLMNQEGSSLLEDYAHVAVQIDPEEGRIQEPERARRYVESYFRDSRLHRGASISIYWGSAEHFARELQQRWKGGVG
jgi:hypothetical protein